MSLYVPIIVLGALADGVRRLLLGRGRARRPKRWNRAKLEFYECGIEPTPAADRHQVPGQVLPDGDAVHRLRHRDHLPVPVGRRFDRLGVFGLVEMVTFIATVLVAYAYVWRRGGLEWD